MKQFFRRGDILLPASGDMTKWSVVACDQFSSQPEYWEALDREIGEAPSTLRLIFPEAFLSGRSHPEEAARINAVMERYLAEGVFRELRDSYVYLRRTLPGGAVRQGLLGLVDLEAYDYDRDSTTPVRATEGTIESRLPPRVRVRERAPLELPHVMVFLDDPEHTVIAPLETREGAMEKLYDFPLSAGGGRIAGWRVTGKDADAVDGALERLWAPERLLERYGGEPPAALAVGDGNHSLATAKACWENLKRSLTEAELETHPARFSLVELVNIHDPAIEFEPIHRCIFGTDPSAFLREAREVFAERYPGGKEYPLRLVTGEEDVTLTASAASIGELIGAAEGFCVGYSIRHGGRIDYIHNDETALQMGREGAAALLLPKMDKGELFSSVIRSGPFPKKSFSIGRAEEKRYYLECRKIR